MVRYPSHVFGGLTVIAGFPDAALRSETEPAIGLLSDHQAVEAKLTEILSGHIHCLACPGEELE